MKPNQRYPIHRFMLILLLVALTGCAVMPTVTPAPVAPRDPADEQVIVQQLQALDPVAVPLYQLATSAYDASDYVQAKTFYEQLAVLVPTFSTTYRRLSYIEVILNNDLVTGTALARKAVELEPNSWNKSNLALMLYYSTADGASEEGFNLASEAVAMTPDDIRANTILLLSAGAAGNETVIRQVDAHLLNLDPTSSIAHYFAGLIDGNDGKWQRAESELLLSKALGMDAAAVQTALDKGIARNAFILRFLTWGAIALGLWIAGLGLLYLVGNLLSRATVRSLEKMEPTVGAKAQPAEQSIRSMYRAVINILSLYYYISIPFAVFSLFMVVGGVFAVFLLSGWYSIQISVLLGLMFLVSLFAILRTIFLRPKEPSPGRPLSRSDAPELWSMVEQVARRMETRPVDRIYINPYTAIAVNEKGSSLEKMRGTGERILVLGMGLLPCLNQGQFAAILAHEYGHFNNRDTAGGNLPNRVSVSLNQMAFGLSRGGAAHVFNPVWLFLVAYQRIFLRVTLGASRLQEVLADRQAAMAFGRTNSVEGLRAIVRQTINFQVQASYELRRSFELKQTISNIYRLPVDASLQEKMDQAFDAIMKRKTSPYDSHPAMPDRIALIDRMRIPYMLDQENAAPLLDLFPNPEELQVAMTSEMIKNVKKR